MDANDLSGAPKRPKAKQDRLRRIFPLCLLWAFVVLTTACTPAGGRPAKPALSTPLLADFTRFCLDTRLKRESALSAAKRAGLELQTIPAGATRADIPMVMWYHRTKATVVLIGLGGEEKGSDGAVYAITCQAADPKDGGASLNVLNTWLGPGHRLKMTGAVHEFQFKDGRVWPINGDDPKAVAISRATGNHYVLTALHLKTVTTVSLRRWRPPSQQAR
jgi:hypothetical protein